MHIVIKMRVEKIEKEVGIPEKVEVSIGGGILSVKGPKGEIKRKLTIGKVNMAVKEKNVILSAKKPTKREKKIIGSFRAHLKNMFDGVMLGHKYMLKICSGHFPMNVSIVNKELVIKNFLGEKFPRMVRLKEGATVKVEGDLIVVESVDKELAGQVSADIECATKRSNYDTRVFQDGIYIINKDGKEIK